MNWEKEHRIQSYLVELAIYLTLSSGRFSLTVTDSFKIFFYHSIILICHVKLHFVNSVLKNEVKSGWKINQKGLFSTEKRLNSERSRRRMHYRYCTVSYKHVGTCCHLISRTVMLVANSSSRALRLGSLCKPTHKRRLWELCLSGAFYKY